MQKKDVKVPFIILALIIELVFGGAGRLIVIGERSISERFILFGFAMLYWVYSGFNGNKVKVYKTKYGIHVMSVFIMLIIAIVVGIINNNDFSNIISNFQGYSYLLLFFPFVISIKTKDQALKIFNLFINCAVILSVIIIILNFLMKIGFSYTTLANYMEKYGLGMISYTGETPRVFFKGSILVMVAFGNQLLIVINNYHENMIRSFMKLAILGLATIFSYTMGIWLGAFVVVLLIIVLQWKNLKGSTIFVGFIVLLSIIYFEKDTVLKVLQLRTKSTDISGIVKSQQIKVLFNLWRTHPFVGAGLGKEITIATVTGNRVMSQFESSWLQLLMNTGIFGLFIYGSLIVRMCIDGFLKLQNSDSSIRILGLSVFLSGISLSIVNWFNPALNNPIGIGYLVINLTILNVIRKEKFSFK
ncbi:O-antigen ligase family protein [Dellaglioa algida]|uniref:O-antigen ligase family protein n=1 Tax=Dellaglioa algida TaxID=105612 RepID=UPI0024C4CA48|nr:O-antigen ligase family protein [Dellaglioa algida]MDK1724759.1 O-antigen ligase family protein [Dellaglioa algida]MDK1738701.1 O-antigen ligase family protein [Dellaglioa algida]